MGKKYRITKRKDKHFYYFSGYKEELVRFALLCKGVFLAGNLGGANSYTDEITK